MNMKKIKNKYFLPTVLLSIVVIAVSVFSISKRKDFTIIEKVPSSNEEVGESVISFSWREGERPVLLMSASEEVSIGAIDLYIGYRNSSVSAVTNMGQLPEPAFLRISSDSSLVVLNYLITADDGFKIFPGQSVEVVQLDVLSEIPDGAELFIDQETNIVDNDTVRGLTYKSENLIINSSL